MPDPKSQIFEELATVARTLGQAHRLELLEHIAQGARPVERLAKLAGMSVANTSQHLQHLRRSGIVKTRRAGKHVLYALSDGPIESLLAALRTFVGHTNAEVRDIIANSFTNLDEMEPVTRDDLMGRLDTGEVLIIDVRPEDEYALGHLPGAISLPLADLGERLSELPSNKEIVAYCRGPYCVLSFEAVASLRARGYQVRRLVDGFPEWKAAGLAVEIGN